MKCLLIFSLLIKFPITKNKDNNNKNIHINVFLPHISVKREISENNS